MAAFHVLFIYIFPLSLWELNKIDMIILNLIYSQISKIKERIFLIFEMERLKV